MVDEIEIAYREAGNPGAPAVVLLHDFATSSEMYLDLIRRLADAYYVIAPDYPGYEHREARDPAAFAAAFDSCATAINGLLEQKLVYAYAATLMGYGAAVGWRLASAHPERIIALMIQSGEVHQEPHDKARNQTDPPYDHRTNVALYPRIRPWLRERQPPTLLIWGKDDPIIPEAAAHAYRSDLRNLELHLLDSGHLSPADQARESFALIRDFLDRKVQIKPGPGMS